MTKLFPNTGEDFSGFHDAERWLIGLGYSVGPMQGTSPVGVVKGDERVAKWRHLSTQQRQLLDGRIVQHGGFGFRDGSALVALDYEPEGVEAAR